MAAEYWLFFFSDVRQPEPFQAPRAFPLRAEAVLPAPPPAISLSSSPPSHGSIELRALAPSALPPPSARLSSSYAPASLQTRVSATPPAPASAPLTILAESMDAFSFVARSISVVTVSPFATLSGSGPRFISVIARG